MNLLLHENSLLGLLFFPLLALALTSILLPGIHNSKVDLQDGIVCISADWNRGDMGLGPSPTCDNGNGRNKPKFNILSMMK
jgi:hypothetical protein